MKAAIKPVRLRLSALLMRVLVSAAAALIAVGGCSPADRFQGPVLSIFL